MTEPLLWHRLRGIRTALTNTLFDFTLDTYGWAGVFEAWDEFQGYDENAEFDQESAEQQLFVPWLLFDWTPVLGDTHVPLSLPNDVPPAAHCLATKPELLDPLARSYVEACCASPFRFVEVLATDPGHGLTLRDLLTGTELEVLEKKASLHLSVGDATFAKLVSLEDITVIEAVAHFKLPPSAKEKVAALGKKLARRRPIRDEDLSGHFPELLGVYRELRDEVFKPNAVETVESDGHPPLQ